MPSRELKDREPVWQHYSEDAWKKIRRRVDAGELTVRADLKWLYDFIMAPKEVVERLLDHDLEETKKQVKAIYWLWGLIWAMVLGLAIAFFKLNGLYGCVALGVLNYMYSQGPPYRPMGKGIIVFYLMGVAAFSYLGGWQPTYIALGIFGCSVFLFPYFVIWTVRRQAAVLLFNDYDFFKQTTGRPYEQGERPPVVIVTPEKDIIKKGETIGVHWDENEEPVLLEDQVFADFPTIIGPDFGHYITIPASRLILFLLGVYCAFIYSTPDKSVHLDIQWLPITQFAVGAALIINIIYAFICPCEQFRAYQKQAKKDGKDHTSASVYASWLFKNTVATIISIAIIAVVSLYLLPYTIIL